MKLLSLSNKTLIDELLALRGKEREVSLQVLLHLIEVDKRKLYRDYGYSSLFAFAKGKLGYSDAGASRRISAARIMEECPEIISMFERGEVSIGTISALADTLTKEKDVEKRNEIIETLPTLSRRKIEKMKAAANPVKPVKESVRPVAVKRAAKEVLSLFEANAPADGSTGGSTEIKDLEQRFKVMFSMSEGCMEKYEEVKLLLSNKLGRNAPVEKLFQVLLDEYLAKYSPKRKVERRKKRLAKVKKSSVVRNAEKKRSRHIPEVEKNKVFLRDGGRCTFVGEDGRRCEERSNLHYDHIRPFALGGKSTADNLRLLCSCHNRLMAERVFGEEFMAACGSR